MTITERMNQSMRQLAPQPTRRSALESSLRILLDAGFVERDGCVFLALEADSAPGGNLLDQTGREALINHVHIDDRLGRSDRDEVLGQGWLYAHGLADRLASAFPGRAFDVVFAVGDSSTVRFYRRRATEAPWILSDLESYKHEAMLVLMIE